MPEYKYEEYLGDGVYAAYDGEGIILTTADRVGGNPANIIYLEPVVISVFKDYLIFLRKKGVPV